MDDPVQFLRTPTSKRQFGKRASIQASIGANDLRAEALDDAVVDRPPRLHELAPNLIGVDDRNPEVREHAAHRRLAAAQSAGKSNAQHQAGKPRRILAARTVLDISMAMVSGPTPPGTGVNAPLTA